MTWIENSGIEFSADKFWNPVDTLEFMRGNPEFMAWTRSLDLRVKSISVTYGARDNCCGAHIDTPPARFKLGWPVHNTKHTFTRWFRLSTDHPTTSINSIGGTAFLDSHELVEIDRLETVVPAIIDAGIPHDVIIGPGAQLPRIGLQCQLFNEPESL
jgi:hypothetical protein